MPISDVAPATGPLKEVLDQIQTGHRAQALRLARGWRERDPADVLALVALGEAWEALGDPDAAARAYGSIIDLFPGRADLRRFAGERLERHRLALAQHPPGCPDAGAVDKHAQRQGLAFARQCRKLTRIP